MLDKHGEPIAHWKGGVMTAMAAAIRVEEYRQQLPNAKRIIVDLAVAPPVVERLPGQDASR